MRTLYLILAIIGYLVPNALVLLESVENHNLLLWTKLKETITATFVNRITTIFALDLLLATLAFFVWSYFESKRLKMKRVGLYWLLTLLFGLAGTLPFFLWKREKVIQTKEASF